MRKKVIQLPKGYLSYSQIQLWKNSKERYKKLYFDNNKSFTLDNSGLSYGKIVADALEYEKETGDLLTDAAMLLLEKYDIRDQKIITEIKSKDGVITVLGRPDTLNSHSKAFREYKTGKGVWTHAKANKYPQMLFYAMLIYLKYKIVLKEAYLDWIETMDETKLVNGEIVMTGNIIPTGKVESFKVTFTLGEILKEMADTIKVAKEIETEFMFYTPKEEKLW